MTTHSTQDSHKPKLKIFVGGVKPTTKPRNLKNFLISEFPSIFRVEVPMKSSQKHPRANKGFAVLHIRCSQEHNRILTLKKLDFEDNKLIFREFLSGDRLRRSQKRKNSTKLFIPHIPDHLPISEVRQALETSFGSIEDVLKFKNRTRTRTKCYAHCYFRTIKSAVSALKKKFVHVGGIRLKLKEFKDVNKSPETQSSAHKDAINKRSHGDIHWMKPTSTGYFNSELRVGTNTDQFSNCANLRLNPVVRFG